MQRVIGHVVAATFLTRHGHGKHGHQSQRSKAVFGHHLHRGRADATLHDGHCAEGAAGGKQAAHGGLATGGHPFPEGVGVGCRVQGCDLYTWYKTDNGCKLQYCAGDTRRHACMLHKD